MYAQILTAVLLIPFGLSTLQRGSEGLNKGRFGAGEAGAMALAGVVMILSGLALLMGAIAAGVPALAALLAATLVWARQRVRARGRLEPGELAGRAAWIGVIALLIVAGWR